MPDHTQAEKDKNKRINTSHTRVNTKELDKNPKRNK